MCICGIDEALFGMIYGKEVFLGGEYDQPVVTAVS